MSTEDLNENNNLSSQNQENSESITNIYNSIDFYYNIKTNEKPIFETKIILDFKKNLTHAIVIEDISDKEGKEELIKDLLNNYMIGMKPQKNYNVICMLVNIINIALNVEKIIAKNV